MKRWLKSFSHFCAVMTAFFCTLIAAVIRWTFLTWPHLKLEELRYELRAPLAGTGGGLIESAVLQCGVPALIVLIVMTVLVRVLGKKNPSALSRVLFAVCASAVFLGASTLGIGVERLDLAGYRSRMAKNHSYIEDHYVYPDNVGLQFPEKKRNLIYIFLESMETTYADKASGGAFDENRIPELTRLAMENEDFSGASETLNGFYTPYSTTWTMAAMFGHSSGLPLIVNVGNNFMNTQDDFFPSMVSLGDILKREGYNQTLMVGSDANFGGRTLYYTAHGDHKIHDHAYAIAEGLLPPGYHVWWGYEDSKLFEHAKQELLRLSSMDEPFNLTLLTVDTHFEDGYVCPECPSAFGDQYSNVLACSSRQTAAFVEWIKQQDFYKDTAIVLVGDHLTMDADYCVDLDPAYERKTYTAFINAAAEPATDKARAYTTFDLFPTTLSAMGVKIRGDRLALGTDLFSATPTLLETDGWELMDYELKHRSLFMEHLASVQMDHAQCSLNFLRGASDSELLVEVRDISHMDHTLESVVLEVTGSTGSAQKLTLKEQPDRSYTAAIDLAAFEGGIATYRLFACGPDDVSYQMASDSGLLTLCERTDLSGYLDELGTLENHSIFMAAAGDASALMTPEIAEKLHSLGLQTDFVNLGSQSFYAVITPDGVTEECDPASLALRQDMPDGSHFTIVSNGASSDQEGCHIYIGTKDYSPNQAGLNFVVYDNTIGRVVDASVYGDAACEKSAKLDVQLMSDKAEIQLSDIRHALEVKEYQLWCWDDKSIGMPHKYALTESEGGVYTASVELKDVNPDKLHMAVYAVCAPAVQYGITLELEMDRLIPLAAWQK